MTARRTHLVTGNGGEAARARGTPTLRLDYRPQHQPKVRISLPDFVRGVYHLPDRILDLLEIASYVFAADRMISRGATAAVEYHSWPRKLQFVIKVRDFAFWNRAAVREKLASALCFMTGDESYGFSFQPGHSTPPTSLFDAEQFRLQEVGNVSVVLFSGGLDSLTGVVDRLTASGDQVCLVSHQAQPGTKRTQNQLYEALARLYSGRVSHYKFYCSLHGVRADEESQRTRAFLYFSIAYSLAHAFSQDTIWAYENGVTALNFPKRQDLMNARASRTAHPKTIRLLEEFLEEVAESRLKIETPFLWSTKTEVAQRLGGTGLQHLLPSTVSCSKTFQNLGSATHCGACSQCIDRRFAVYAAGLQEIDDSGIYAFDFIRREVPKGETRAALIDYVRQARAFAGWNLDHFHDSLLSRLVDVGDGLRDMDEQGLVTQAWNLCRRHGEQVLAGIRRMRECHDDPFNPLPMRSFLHMVSEREYLKEPVARFVEGVSARLSRATQLAYQRSLPRDETDLNDKIAAFLISDKAELEREHPAVKFALSHAKPDHSSAQHDVFIEAKYIRGSTSPSRVSEGMSADLVKYGSSHVLFVVFDPERAISDPARFKADFESRGGCSVLLIR